QEGRRLLHATAAEAAGADGVARPSAGEVLTTHDARLGAGRPPSRAAHQSAFRFAMPSRRGHLRMTSGVQTESFSASKSGTAARPDAAAAISLLSAAAVRERAQRMLDLALAGRLPHFSVDLGRLDGAVDLVLTTVRRAYPSLDVPFHSRWRHFVSAGTDRW